jgi:hypothetical protein
MNASVFFLAAAADSFLYSLKLCLQRIAIVRARRAAAEHVRTLV